MAGLEDGIVLQPSEFVGCCQILSDFAPLKTRSTYARSKYPTQLAKMNFEKILDLTAVVFLIFYGVIG